MDFDISLSLICYALFIKLYINYDQIDIVFLSLKSVKFFNPVNIQTCLKNDLFICAGVSKACFLKFLPFILLANPSP